MPTIKCSLTRNIINSLGKKGPTSTLLSSWLFGKFDPSRKWSSPNASLRFYGTSSCSIY